MKKVIKNISAIILTAALLISSLMIFPYARRPGTVYYVDSVNGSDDNSGVSESSAWKTLDKITLTTFQSGDAILLKSDGIFTGTLDLKGSGTKENPIIISSYGSGAKPVVTTLETGNIIKIIDCSYWTIENLEITAPNGSGIWINTVNSEVRGITIENITFHDFNYELLSTWDSTRNAIQIKSITSGSAYPVSDVLIKDCEFYEMNNGVLVWGSWARDGDAWCILKGEQPEVAYNDNIVVDSCSFHDLWDTAMIMGMSKNSAARNCSVINCCLAGSFKYCTAPFWFWGSTHSVIENCEVAGTLNTLDGMTVDFDSHTNNCTYQYVYSHDNTRFMWNCVYGVTAYDSINNMVRYCLSVNDNTTDNGEYSYKDGFTERHFRFYNNTIVNGSRYNFSEYTNAVIQNNIFVIPFFWLNKSISPIEFDASRHYTLSNNCYYGCIKPFRDSGSLNTNPGFVSWNLSDMNSFALAADSPLIGAGTQAEADMGAHDFYGNPLTDTHNIGCFDAPGLEKQSTSLTDWINIIKDVSQSFRNWIVKTYLWRFL